MRDQQRPVVSIESPRREQTGFALNMSSLTIPAMNPKPPQIATNGFAPPCARKGRGNVRPVNLSHIPYRNAGVPVPTSDIG